MADKKKAGNLKFAQRMDRLIKTKSPLPIGFLSRWAWLDGNDVDRQQRLQNEQMQRYARLLERLPYCQEKGCEWIGQCECDLCRRAFCTRHSHFADKAGTADAPLMLRLCEECRPAEKYWTALIDARLRAEAEAEIEHRAKQGLKRKLSVLDAYAARCERPVYYDRRGRTRRRPKSVLLVEKH